MEIKILYDNKTAKSSILAGWGFSCLVGGSVLFDTGEDGKSLLSNMKKMKVDIAGIKDIVISHDHGDHTGGLEALLKRKKDFMIHGCKGFSPEFKAIVKRYNVKLVEEKYFSTIKGNVFTTGVIGGLYKNSKIEEQSLVLKTANGMSIVTGCAHPGIVKIVERIKKLFPQEKIYSVFGGFHLKEMSAKEINVVCEKLKELGLQKAGPAHCSGEKGISIFKEKFSKNFISIAAGKTLEV